ncbi:MAG: BBP7 family outer membrane beta-barrel protein [Planctomycetota bacterium]
MSRTHFHDQGGILRDTITRGDLVGCVADDDSRTMVAERFRRRLFLSLSTFCGSRISQRYADPICEAAATAETFAMQRMIRNFVNPLTIMTLKKPHGGPGQYAAAWISGLAITAALLTSASSQAQSLSLANYDFDASGYVAPAGMPPAGMMPPGAMAGAPVMPVGFFGSGCDTGGCDTLSMMGGMDPSCCGTCGTCGDGGILGGGGLLGKLRCGQGGCYGCGDSCSGYGASLGYIGENLSHALGILMPYEEAGICNQRWYDASLEALVLDRNIGGGVPDIITTTGIAGTPALTLDDVGADDLEVGVRASIAFIFGVGGNIEATYMGSNEWSGTASAQSTSGSLTNTTITPNLYSFVSEFGTNPLNGFDDTDRSNFQGLVASSEFHSAEINYRRRTMFPYCHFQSSWLVGLRYLRYDDSLLYFATGANDNTAAATDPRFFQSDTSTQNSLFGPQAGFDFWWNACPGVSIGVGSKVAWMQNDVERRTSISANSAGINATPGQGLVEDSDQETTVMGDFELKGVYRFSHSLSLRGSYYILAVEDVQFGGLSGSSIQSIISQGNAVRPFEYDDLVLQGFTIGAEYMW